MNCPSRRKRLIFHFRMNSKSIKLMRFDWWWFTWSHSVVGELFNEEDGVADGVDAAGDTVGLVGQLSDRFSVSASHGQRRPLTPTCNSWSFRTRYADSNQHLDGINRLISSCVMKLWIVPGIWEGTRRLSLDRYPRLRDNSFPSLQRNFDIIILFLLFSSYRVKCDD